jgi:hypothetical protein
MFCELKGSVTTCCCQSTTEAGYMAIVEACKKSFGSKVCMLIFVEMIFALTYFVTVKVSYSLQKIKCSIRGQSLLMSSTIMVTTLLLKVN